VLHQLRIIFLFYWKHTVSLFYYYIILLSKYNKYQERAKKLLENTYPEIKDKVEILNANKIKELRDMLNKYGDEIKKLINLGK